MKTCNIFLASSYRLSDERDAIEKEIARLNDTFTKRGVYLQLDIWEKFDAANDPERKQDLYNEYIKRADIFLVVYHGELGAFTQEEYLTARQRFKESGLPRIYLFKKTSPAEFNPSTENVENLRSLEALWNARDQAQWPWEFDHKTELVKKFSDDLQQLFSNPELPHFSFPEVRKLSLNNPATPVGFLGRESELKTIYEKLHGGGRLMLINAEGGIGKTTLAARYWSEALDNYQHAAWLFCEGGIVNSLKELAPQLDIDLNGMDEPQQLQALKRGLHKVQKDFLLVLDNANDEKDIRLFKQEFEGFHWHVLITSRCRGVLDEGQELPITHLPPPLAKALFTRYYKENTPEFDSLLDRVLLAINYHTLLTEVFAKNLAEAAEIGLLNLATFLDKLENGGLYLKEDSFEIRHNEWAEKRKAATTDDILDALYDFNQLTEEQRFLLVNLALLPAESYDLPFINSLLTNDTDRTVRQLRHTMKSLVRKGWVSESNRTYRLSPVIQQLVLEKHADTLGNDSWDLLERLNYITETDGYHFVRTSLSAVAPYIHPVHQISHYLRNESGVEIAHYNFRASTFYSETGDMINAQRTSTRSSEIFQMLLFKEPKNLVYKHNLAALYRTLGKLQETMGNNQGALLTYQKCSQLSKEILKDDPDNVSYQHNLALSYAALGGVHKLAGDREDAFLSFQEYNRLCKEIHKSSPDNLNYKNTLAVSYSKLGNIYETAGNWKDALFNYKKCNKLIKTFHENEPDNLIYKSGLATSYRFIAGIQEATGEIKRAMTNYKKFHILSKVVHESDSEKIIHKDSLSASYSHLGRMYENIGNLKKAQMSYRESNKLIEEIHESNPDNIEYKHGLAISYRNLGQIQESIGDMNKALKYYKKSNALSRTIHKDSPDTLSYKHTLAISHRHLAYVYELIGDRKNTLKNYLEDNRLNKDIHEKDPNNFAYKVSLVRSYYLIGGIQDAEGDQENALNNYLKSKMLNKEICESAPNNLNLKNSLAVSCTRLGWLYKMKGDSENAIKHHQECNNLMKEIHNATPEDITFKKNLANSYCNLGRIYETTGDLKNSLVNYQKYVKVVRTINKLDPDNITYKNKLVYSYSILGQVYEKAGDIKNALKNHRKYNMAVNNLFKSAPHSLDYKSDLAYSSMNLGLFYFEQYEDTDALLLLTEGKKLFSELQQTTDGKNAKFAFNFALCTKYISSIVKSLITNNHYSAEQVETSRNEIKAMRREAHEVLLSLLESGALAEDQQKLLEELANESWYEF